MFTGFPTALRNLPIVKRVLRKSRLKSVTADELEDLLYFDDHRERACVRIACPKWPELLDLRCNSCFWHSAQRVHRHDRRLVARRLQQPGAGNQRNTTTGRQSH